MVIQASASPKSSEKKRKEWEARQAPSEYLHMSFDGIKLSPVSPVRRFESFEGTSAVPISPASYAIPAGASAGFVSTQLPHGSFQMHGSIPGYHDADAVTVLKAIAQLPSVAPEIPMWDENNERMRSVYIENVPTEATNAEIIQLVGAGALERMRRFVEKRCVIFVFLKYESALRFYAEFFMNDYDLHGQPLNIGWLPTAPMAPEIKEAVEKDGASRNVFLEQHFDDDLSVVQREDALRKELEGFGIIENIHSIPHRKITFVYFTSVASAVSAVKELRRRSEAGDEQWKRFTIAYGKDPCQSLLKLKKQASLLYLGRSPYDTTALAEYDQDTIDKAIAYQSIAAVLTASISGGDLNIGNRCIFIGNCPPNTRLVDICNTVRGGMIENIRFFSDRGICFVTFLEPCAAAQFYATYHLHRLLINGKLVKVGWGKHSGRLQPDIERAISRGVTRNVCIKDARPRHQSGRLIATEAEILEKFAPFGPIEQIKISPELGCIFITFVCISKTMQAVEWAKANKVVPNSHIQYGKDRCATFPRFLSNMGSYGGDEGDPACCKRGSDPVLIAYLRRELIQLSAMFGFQQMQPMSFCSSVVPTGPVFYPLTSYYGGVVTGPAMLEAQPPDADFKS